jgi:hypothetical protein
MQTADYMMRLYVTGFVFVALGLIVLELIKPSPTHTEGRPSNWPFLLILVISIGLLFVVGTMLLWEPLRKGLLETVKITGCDAAILVITLGLIVIWLLRSYGKPPIIFRLLIARLAAAVVVFALILGIWEWTLVARLTNPVYHFWLSSQSDILHLHVDIIQWMLGGILIIALLAGTAGGKKFAKVILIILAILLLLITLCLIGSCTYHAARQPKVVVIQGKSPAPTATPHAAVGPNRADYSEVRAYTIDGDSGKPTRIYVSTLKREMRVWKVAGHHYELFRDREPKNPDESPDHELLPSEEGEIDPVGIGHYPKVLVVYPRTTGKSTLWVVYRKR